MQFFECFFFNNIVYFDMLRRENTVVPPCHLPGHQTWHAISRALRRKHSCRPGLWVTAQTPSTPTCPSLCCAARAFHRATSRKLTVGKFIQESVFPGLWSCLHLSQWFWEHCIASEKQGFGTNGKSLKNKQKCTFLPLFIVCDIEF